MRYEEEQDELEAKYIQSLPERYDAIIEYAIDILSGDCDNDTYHSVFSEYYDEYSDTYNTYILATIDTWLDEGIEGFNEDDIDVMRTLARKALRVACEEIYNEELYILAGDGMWRVDNMIGEVVGV
jgi:hypothetical protein